MTRQGVLILAVLAFVAGATAFYIGRTRAAGQSWLKNAPREAVEADRQFEEQARRLADAVRAEQIALATMLADANSSGEQVFGQVDRTTESHGTLIRTVGRHLVQLRDTLPRSQAKTLMQWCAGSVRGQVQRRYRWHGGAQDAAGGRGYMGGRGTMGRRGRGGPGYRGGQSRGRAGSDSGLVRSLQLTDEQVAWIGQQDPNFEPDCSVLKDRLNGVHTQLVASLEDAQIDREVLLKRIDDLVQAHADLEKRVARHVVLLRPHLSAEQRERLAGLCGGAGGLQRGNPAQVPGAGERSILSSFLPQLTLGEAL